MGSLLLLLAIAYGARFIWNLLSPMLPTLMAVVVLAVVIMGLVGLWRR